MSAWIYLSVGTSFADIWVAKAPAASTNPQFLQVSRFAELIQKSEILQTKKVFFAQESLASVLKKIKEELNLTTLNVVLKSRFYEKFLVGKLSGSVAHVVTSGFESWATFRQPLTTKSFNLFPQRIDPLINPEFVFGLNERMDSKGHVIKSLEMNELEFIESKLKLINVKRVCLNLLFSHVNSAHLNTAKNFFEEKGFQVFAETSMQAESDEMPVWRKNMINSVLTSVHDDLLTEISSVIDGGTIYFFTKEGVQASEDYKDYLNLVVSFWNDKFHSERKRPLLYLGLESFAFFFADQQKNVLQSNWGDVRTKAYPRFEKLRLQPTSLISKHTHQTLIYSKEEVGFEPGPMVFGRSFKPSFFDVFVSEVGLQQLNGWVQPQGIRKFHDQMSMVFKDYNTNNLKEGLTEMLQTAAKILADEVELLCVSNQVDVTGEFATGMLPYLKKYTKKHFEILPDEWTNR